MPAPDILEQDRDKCIRDDTRLKNSFRHAVRSMLSVRQSEHKSSNNHADVDGRHKQGLCETSRVIISGDPNQQLDKMTQLLDVTWPSLTTTMLVQCTYVVSGHGGRDRGYV